MSISPYRIDGYQSQSYKTIDPVDSPDLHPQDELDDLNSDLACPVENAAVSQEDLDDLLEASGVGQHEIVPMDQYSEESQTVEDPFSDPNSNPQSRQILDSMIAEWARLDGRWAANYTSTHEAILLLPPKLRTRENFSAVVAREIDRRYGSGKCLAEWIALLPQKLQTQENFDALNKAGYCLSTVRAIRFLSPELQTQEMLGVLTKTDYPIQVAHAIMLLPDNLRNQEMLGVLTKTNYPTQVAQAVMLLPDNLRNQETIMRLVEMESSAVETALALIAPGDIDEAAPLENDADLLAKNHPVLSRCAGRRPVPCGRGYIYEFQILPKYLECYNPYCENAQEFTKIQEQLLPALEGPFRQQWALPPYRVFSEGMWHFVRCILREEIDPNQPLFTNCERAIKLLSEQLERFERLQQIETPEAIAVDRLLSTFKHCYSKLKLSALGFSYTAEKGRWTVPDVDALRNSLQEADFKIGEVDGIVSDIEFLDKVLDCDVVIGDFAHDTWFHAYTQLKKFFTDPDQYIQARDEARSMVRCALDGLNQYPKKNAQDELLCRVFLTVLGMYLDLTTADPSFNTHKNLDFLELYRKEEYESMLAKMYPQDLDTYHSKMKFWYGQFLPFARDLVGAYVKDEKAKQLLLKKL